MVNRICLKGLRKLGIASLIATLAIWSFPAHAVDCPPFIDPDSLPRAINDSFQFDPFSITFAPGEFCDNIAVEQRGTEGITFHDFWDKECNPIHSHIQVTESGTYTAGDRVVTYTIKWLGRGEEGVTTCDGDVCKHCSSFSQSGMIRKTTIPGPPVKVINDSGSLVGRECCNSDENGECLDEPTFDFIRTAGVDGDFFPKHVEATCSYLESQ